MQNDCSFVVVGSGSSATSNVAVLDPGEVCWGGTSGGGNDACVAGAGEPGLWCIFTQRTSSTKNSVTWVEWLFLAPFS